MVKLFRRLVSTFMLLIGLLVSISGLIALIGRGSPATLIVGVIILFIAVAVRGDQPKKKRKSIQSATQSLSFTLEDEQEDDDWRDDDPTDAQIRYAEVLGIEFDETHITKGELSDLITQAKAGGAIPKTANELELAKLLKSIPTLKSPVERHEAISRLLEVTYRAKEKPGMLDLCIQHGQTFLDELSIYRQHGVVISKGFAPLINALLVLQKHELAMKVCDRGIKRGVSDGTSGGLPARRKKIAAELKRIRP